MKQNKSLRERCNINTNYDGNRFVGIRFHQGDATINFPLGYNIENLSDNELRTDIRNLIDIIGDTVNRKESVINIDTNILEDDEVFPIHSYIFVIQDFIARGYYKETEIIYKTSTAGKVNWSRTIKNQKPVIQDNEAYYLNLTVRKNKNNYNELISLIHKYCVYESYDKMGWLYTSFVPEPSPLEYDYKLFRGVIVDKIQNTFNDRNKELFLNMLAIIDYQGNMNAPDTYMYGTNRFEYVWEKLINRVYGIDDKYNFFPKTEWHVKGEKPYDCSKLEPDTIMKYNGDIYVLDAKYYKYGYTLNPADLPQSSDINKQITYGEYVERLRDATEETFEIFNAFIMPFDSEHFKGKKSEPLINIGEAKSKWKENSKAYEKIQGILVDTRYFMNIVTNQNKEEIKKLAKTISCK